MFTRNAVIDADPTPSARRVSASNDPNRPLGSPTSFLTLVSNYDSIDSIRCGAGMPQERFVMVDMVHSMRIFVRVVEAGTFTAVAKESDTTTAQVSRAVSVLEDELQTLLLHRTTRHLSVTEAGAKYFERAKLILAELDNANV